MAHQAGNNQRGSGQGMSLNLNTNQLEIPSQTPQGENKRYSWEDTPIEMQNHGLNSFHQSSYPGEAPVTIPSSTSPEQAMWSTTQGQAQTQQQQTPQQRSSIQQQQIESQPTIPRSSSPYNIPEPAEPHPA